MSQSPSDSEQNTKTSHGGGEPADFPEIRPVQNVKTGNLADTNSDEYKHKHGEHHHHHHHHRHHHRHFHLFNLSPSGIRDNLKLLFTSVYAYPYILLFLSLLFLFLMKSGLAVSILNRSKGSFSSDEIFFRWQEILIMKEALLIRIPFQFTLLVSVVITLVLANRQERHWQRNVMKLIPALGAAAIFSLPLGGSPLEESNRIACRECLRRYQEICFEYAADRENDGMFPDTIPEHAFPSAKYSSDHFIYRGAGKSATTKEPFILIEDDDKRCNHVGNCRFAILSDGEMLISKYGRPYERYEKDLPPADK